MMVNNTNNHNSNKNIMITCLITMITSRKSSTTSARHMLDDIAAIEQSEPDCHYFASNSKIDLG